jgi:hypothetical protein
LGLGFCWYSRNMTTAEKIKSKDITNTGLSLIIDKNERIRRLKRLAGSISPTRAKAWLREIKKMRNEWR